MICGHPECTGVHNTSKYATLCPRSRERLRVLGRAQRKRHPLRSQWGGIKQRCLNPRAREFSDYGGRGIKMHPQWVHDFPAFEAWILQNLGPRPSQTHSLDRIDNDGNYEPGNLRWATPREQLLNRRNAAEVTGLQQFKNGSYAVTIGGIYGRDVALRALAAAQGIRDQSLNTTSNEDKV